MSQKEVLMNLKLRYTLKDFEIKFKTQARREKELIDLHILLPTKMKVRLVPRNLKSAPVRRTINPSLLI